MRIADQRKAPWTWWSAVALTAVYIVLNGPHRSFFSGVPLSSKSTLLFLAVVCLVVLTAMFRPQRRPRAIWPAAILLLVIAKALLAPMVVDSGWKGVYRTAPTLGTGQGVMTTAWFHTDGVAARQYRIDPTIDFFAHGFGLTYINEVAWPPTDFRNPKRDIEQPLVVRWTGHTYAAEPRTLEMSVSANGRISIAVDGQRRFDAVNPEGTAVNVPVPAGPHVVSIVYDKPMNVEPRARVATQEAVTVTPADPRHLQRSVNAGRAIDAMGIIALLLLLIAFIDAYTPLRAFFGELRSRPDKLAAVAMAVFFIVRGVQFSIPSRHSTVQIGIGDDPLAYETDARLISRNGLLLLDDAGKGQPYFFYPLYSYTLAAAHILFGDDFSNIYLFNYLCMAATMLLMWALLRRYLSRIAIAVVLVLVLAPFAARCYGHYAQNAYSDNLFGPMVLAMLLACATALERRSTGWLFATGLLTALAAAARASLMTHIAFICAAVLLYRNFGDLRRRLTGCAAAVAGFALALAPFTLRNWIVAKKFVLLVSSVVQMPYFMFIWGEEEMPPLTIDGRPATFVESLQQLVEIWSSDPAHFTWHEIKKVLFTLGYVDWTGPRGVTAPWFLILFPPLFAIALWQRRIPRPLAFTLVAFLASHMLSMVMAAPWTYGYKTILPFMMAAMAGAAFLLPRAPSAAESRADGD